MLKLNNNLVAKKRGEDPHEPAYKCDMIFKMIVHNVNALALHANPDQCGDKMSYGFEGWGESESGLVCMIKNKPEITKGMQTVITSDVDWICLRACIHRHKKHPKLFTNQGPTKARLLWESQLLPLCQPDNILVGETLFQTKPHMTWDFFSGAAIIEHAAQEGFGLTITCRRDCLPEGVPQKFFLHKKTQVTHRTRRHKMSNQLLLSRNTLKAGWQWSVPSLLWAAILVLSMSSTHVHFALMLNRDNKMIESEHGQSKWRKVRNHIWIRKGSLTGWITSSRSVAQDTWLGSIGTKPWCMQRWWLLLLHATCTWSVALKASMPNGNTSQWASVDFERCWQSRC